MLRRAFGVVGLAAVIAGTVIGAGALGLSGSAPTLAGAPRSADTFAVDAVHSAVIYRIKHLNTSYHYGRFNDVSGTFNIADGGSIDITVKTDSIDSGNAKRDAHLKSPDFFSSKEFGEITFKSSSIKKTGESTFEATGQLTLHGVTKDVTVAVEKAGEGPGMQGKGKIQGFEAKLAIKRSDYSMGQMLQAIGDDVNLIVSIEGGSK